ncbi:hypothetical protein FQR65_LT09199 [Abscondita terminalis]|nr:hypothetical protein FQR65_LT09199 [Abscondita terminalis]
MSTFSGKIVEIPEISVDNFEGQNTNSLVYFLSHCHTDHMRGLNNPVFQNVLSVRSGVYLYASSISIKILKNDPQYSDIGRKLKEIPVHNATLIKIPHREQFFTVTALPAGHCPGSVMFLFEINGKNILYTGDYRVSSTDLEKYKAFYSLGKLKNIHKMYLDTTFFAKSFAKFPLRQDSINSICSYIKEWLEMNLNHLINVVPSANYGSEYLLMEIAKKVLMPIHVGEKCYNVYKCIPEMDGAITLDPKTTRIHSNCGDSFKEICLKDNKQIRKIKVSTLWWKHKNIDKSYVHVEKIKSFLLFLKPMEVEACVVPNDLRTKNELIELLNEIILTYNNDDVKDENFRLFACPEIDNDESQSDKETVNDDLDSLLHSPTQTFKRRRKWLSKQDE